MKNLFETVSVENLSRYVWQNNTPNLHEDTMERIDELKSRAMSQAKLSQLMLKVEVEATNGFSKFENDFNNKKPNFTASDLDNLAKYTVSTSSDPEVYKMYRTEVMARINNFLLKEMGTGIPVKEAGELIEKCMKAWPYRSGEIDKALWDAMTMVDDDRQGNKLTANIAKKFKNKIERTKLARLMEKGEQSVQLGETFTFKQKEYTMTECEILTGAAMTQINPKLTSGLYLQNAIMLEGGKQIIAQLENGCEGNFVVIDVKEKGKDDPDPDIPDGFEKMDWNQKIDIGDLPPDIFGEFFKLNPNMHWVEYKDLYNYMEGLPEKDRVEFEQKLTLYVSSKSMSNVQDQLRKDIADPKTPPFQKRLFKAQLKLTMGDDKNVNAGVAELDALIKDPSTPMDVLTMAKDVRSQVEQQFLNENAEALKYRDMNGLWMFRTHLVSREDELNDDWWITDQLQFLWTNDDSEDKAELVIGKEMLETIEELENIMQTDPTVKTLPEALAKMPDQTKATKFKTEYDKFVAKEMAGTPIAEKDPAKITKQEMKKMPEAWLKMADELRERGQYGQAAEVYESIFWTDFKAKEQARLASHKLTTEEENEIDKSVSLAEVRENLRVNKMLDGKTEPEITKLVSQTYKATLEQLKEKALLKKSVDEYDPAIVFPDKNSAKFKAMSNYQDMLGLEEGWDISDETWDTIKKEIILNVALIAVSGGVATLGRFATTRALGAIAEGAGIWGRSARALTTFGTRGVEVGRFGKITIGGVGMAVGEGIVFHEVQSGLTHGDWNTWDENKIRGMAMSALMFNLFRGGNAIYERGLGRSLESNFGTQLQVKDFFRSASNRQALNNGVAISRGRTLGTSLLHKALRTSGETLPFFAINGSVANLTTDENYFTWENLGKDWATLFLLAQLPKIKSKPDDIIVDPIPKPKPPVKPEPKIKKERVYRGIKNIGPDFNGRATLKGNPKDGEFTFGTPYGNGKQRMGKGGVGGKFKQNLRNEKDLNLKHERKMMVKKKNLERANKLKNAEKNLKGVDNLKIEITNNLNTRIKEIENFAKSDPVTAKKQLKEVLNKELGKLGEEKASLVKIRQERKWTSKEEADFNKIRQTKIDIKNNIYQPALKKINAQIDLIHAAKQEAHKENKQRDEAARKAKDVPTENLREDFESMLGEGNKIKVKVEGIERMKEFEITKVKMHNGEIVGIKARADGSPPYNFKINYVDGKVNIQAPNKGKTLDWNITRVEGKQVIKDVKYVEIKSKPGQVRLTKEQRQMGPKTSGKYEVNESGEISRKVPSKKGETREDVLNNDALWEGINAPRKGDNYKDIQVPVAESAPVNYAKNTTTRNIDGKTRRRSPGNKVEESGHKDQKNLQDKDMKKYKK